MLLFVETKRSRRQYFAAWFASCAGHTSTSRRGKNSRSTVVCDEAAVGHRHTKLPDLALVINEKLASSSGKCGNQCCSSARRSAALGKARSWSSFFSVCICFTEASGLTLGLVYIALTNLRFSTSSPMVRISPIVFAASLIAVAAAASSPVVGREAPLALFQARGSGLQSRKNPQYRDSESCSTLCQPIYQTLDVSTSHPQARFA